MSYEAVKRVGQERPGRWLRVIRDCHDTLAWQERAGLADHICAAWVTKQTGHKTPPLTPLVRWGVLERKKWGVVEGHDLDVSGRNYYRMPDRSGVRRALEELGA
jgi:hypothetical protein